MLTGWNRDDVVQLQDAQRFDDLRNHTRPQSSDFRSLTTAISRLSCVMQQASTAKID
jgi:hypothetical protein